MSTIRRYRALLLLVGVAVFALPHWAFASAGGFAGGGGGGGGFGGGGAGGHAGAGGLPDVFVPIWAAALVCYFLVSPVRWALLQFKAARSRAMLVRLSAEDPTWNPDEIESRVRTVFMRVQKAWYERSQVGAAGFASARLNEKHDRLLRSMIDSHKVNMMDGLEFTHATVLGFRATSDPARDRLYVLVRATLHDYVVDERNGRVLDGDAKHPRRLRELWTFLRGDDGWVVDAIDQRPSNRTLGGLKCIVGDRDQR